MQNLKPNRVYKIFTILLITIFLLSGFIFLGFPIDNEKMEDNTNHDQSPKNSTIATGFSDSQETPVNYVTTVAEHQANNEIELFNANNELFTHDNPKSRGNSNYNFDLRIQGINLTYPGFFFWQVNISNIFYTYFIAGEVGEPTNLSVTIRNIGNLNVNNIDNAFITLNLTDYYGYSSWERREYIGHLMPGHELKVNFTWIPMYSNSYNLTCNISFPKDQDLSNNMYKVGNLNVKKWDDDLEDGNIDDWSGDINQDKWHLTNSVEADPNPEAHSNKFTFYHGLEEDGKQDNYGEANDLDLITPEIDLRRFVKNNVLRLYFKYYGNTSETDDLTLEGYKSSDQTWYPLDEIIFPEKTEDTNGKPSWYQWGFGFYLGIPIHTFAGELAKFKIHWHSDQWPEDNIGFYLDDFFIYGIERPLPEYDAGIEAVEIIATTRPIIVGQDFMVRANITNHGTQPIFNLPVNIDVQDLTGRQEISRAQGLDTISILQPGESTVVTWLIKPAVGGIYFINVSIDFALDEIKLNNFFSLTETAEVYIYYTSFESIDQSWYVESGWFRLHIAGKIDPDPTQHSYSTAWYVGNSTTHQVDPNMTSILFSPIIDLDGAQRNLNYIGDQIKIDFNWFGRAGNSDKLYFEYALDHSNNWTLFNAPNKKDSIISGDYSTSWHSWDALGFALGSEELFGHHIQFRWRFEADSESGFTEIGFYVDDFSIWVVQEQFGRPKILGCQVVPISIINDSRDEAVITCEVEMGKNEIDKVFVNLEPLGGLQEQIMLDDGANVDLEAMDNIYSINFTVPPTIAKGEKTIKISVWDKIGNFDNDYLKILVKENAPPIIKNHFPLNSTVILNESEELEFSLEAFDPEGGELQYKWYINSVLNPVRTDNYLIFNTSFKGQFSAGNYTVRIQVFDDGVPGKSAFFEWNIEVIDILPDFKVNKNDIYLNNVNITENELVEIIVQVHNLQKPPENNVMVFFIQQSNNESISDSVFFVQNIKLFNGTASTFITVSWRANSSFNYIMVWIDPEDNISELNEDNNQARIPINVSPEKPEEIELNGGRVRNELEVPYYIYILTTGALIAIISLFITIGTEFGRYKLFLAFAPLYYRVTGDRILEHELRSKIYMYIRAHPGDHYRSIMAALEIKNGTLVHHLSRLEQEDLIKSERDGYFKRFYPVGMRIPKSDVGMYYPEGVATYNIGEHQVSEIQLRIIKIIRNNPGLTQKEIAHKINESRRVVNYHIKLLLQHELIKVIKLGRKTQCFIPDRVTSS